VDDDVPVHLVTQLLDAVRHVALEHRRVRPLRVLQRRGHDVLRHLVELVGELALARRPGFGEALVGLPAEQQRGGVHRLVELELVAVLAALELERPTAVLVVLGAARVLDDAVDRDELGDHDLAHPVSPSSQFSSVALSERRTRRTGFDRG
jgi:hypothetical protein